MNKNQTTALTPLHGFLWKVFLAPCLKLFECVCELAIPYITKYLIDVGIKNKDTGLAIRLSLLILGLAALSFCVTMVAQYLSSRVAADYSYALKKTLFHHLGLLSEKQLNTFGKQKILTLVNNDSTSIQNGVNMFMRLIFRPPFLIIGSTILTFTMDYRAGLIFLGVVLLSSLIVGIVMILSPKRYYAIQENLDGISVVANDTLKGIRPVHAFNKEEQMKEKFNATVDSYEKKNLSMEKINALINPFSFCFMNLGMALIVSVGQIGINDGFLTTGSIVSILSYLTTSLAALKMFERLIVTINKSRASMGRINSFLSIGPDIVNTEHPQPEKEAPLFEFRNVSLNYAGGNSKPAVSGLNFTIHKGEWIGLIGGTGSGKSTTISLMERIFDPTEGEILFKGRNLKECDLHELRSSLSCVSQKSSLFRGTVKSNLVIAKPDATEEEIEKALKDSLAYEYVSKFDDGTDHEIEEGGNNLSGGQKQRLLIARALLRNSEILILDDATSALDYLSEQTVRRNIAMRKDITKIFVSQRATTFQNFDKILVYDKGVIVGAGTHEELLNSCPIYKEIYDMQRSVSEG